MDIKELEAFYAVAKYRSVTRAAESLHEAQPTISKRLKNLETSTGGTLFLRNRRPLQLTPLGERVFGATAPFVRSLDNIRFALKDEIDHRPVSFMVTYPVSENILLRAVDGFTTTHPDIHLRVRLGTIAEVAATVDRGEVDFGLVHGAVSGRDLSVTDLGLHDRILITPPQHPILEMKSISAKAIAQWPLVVGPAGTYSRETFESLLRKTGTPFETAIEVDNNVAMKRFVIMGFGLAIIPRIAMEESDYEKLGVRSLSTLLPKDRVRLLRMNEVALTERSTVFLDRVTREVERIEAQIGMDSVGESVAS